MNDLTTWGDVGVGNTVAKPLIVICPHCMEQQLIDIGNCTGCGALISPTIGLAYKKKEGFEPMAPPKKAHCLNGHLRTPENLTPARNCILCQKERQAGYRKLPTHKARHKRDRDRARSNLTDGYINRLIQLKTGLKPSEVDEEFRAEYRARVLAYRAKRAINKEAVREKDQVDQKKHQAHSLGDPQGDHPGAFVAVGCPGRKGKHPGGVAGVQNPRF